MLDYQIFDSPDIMAIGFQVPTFLNLNPLQLVPGLLYPGAEITHLGGRKTSAGFFILDFTGGPLVYRGLFHPAEDPPGPLALFTQGQRPSKKGFAEWYYCYHWLPQERCFLWTSGRARTGRVVETDEAVWLNPKRSRIGLKILWEKK